MPSEATSYVEDLHRIDPEEVGWKREAREEERVTVEDMTRGRATTERREDDRRREDEEEARERRNIRMAGLELG